ncbi:MAG: S41 family peptidase [Ferruginibacter sp.]|nr:S41 family peptidase [Cytophagales bacterium]
MANSRRFYGMAFLFLLAGCNFDKAPQPPVLMPDASAPMPDSVARYLGAALDSMQQHSIRKHRIDWPQLRQTTFDQAKGALTYQQTYPAIEAALAALGDNHSFFKTPEQHQAWLTESEQTPAGTNLPIGAMVDEKFAWVIVPDFASGNSAQGQAYASALQEVLRKLDARNPAGWIIDLQSNRGGNMWPMLAGIGPLVGEGILGHFLTADGRNTPWRYERGAAKLDDALMCEVTDYYELKNSDAPVAVLIDENTASSGEAILVSFLGRANTKVFGSASAGLSTANDEYTLEDGAQLILTSAVFTDRSGKKYGKQIVPDVDLSGEWYFIPGLKNITLRQKVKAWIMESSPG